MERKGVADEKWGNCLYNGASPMKKKKIIERK
jgi:hypothetical protein